MPSFVELFGLLAVAAAVGYWVEAMRSKERARAAGRRACEEADAQFLDDTVELTKVRLRRDAHGQVAFYREYRFEFTLDGAFRHRGAMALLGRRVVHVTLEPGRGGDTVH